MIGFSQKKKIEKSMRENAFKQKKKEPGLKFNPGSGADLGGGCRGCAGILQKKLCGLLVLK